MDGNRNWPAWGALLLAGLALFVALSGRFGGAVSVDRFAFRVGPDNPIVTAPAIPAAPEQSKLDQQLQVEAQQLQDEAQALRDKLQQQGAPPPQPVAPGSGPVPAVPQPQAPQLKVVPPFAAPFKGGPWGERGGNFNAGGWHFPFGGFFGFPFGFLMGLPQALIIAGLLWLAWRRFGARRAPPAPVVARRSAVTKRLDPPDQPSPASS